MNLKYFLTAVGFAGLTACSSVYKAGQTPDDVYFSPSKGGESYARVEKQRNDEGYKNYFEEDNVRSEDRYLRMKARDRSRWADLDDYYYNDYYGFGNPYAFNTFGSFGPSFGMGMGYYPGSWGYPGMWGNSLGWNMGWNMGLSSPWNWYPSMSLGYGWGNPWGWGNSFWGPGYYHSNYPYFPGGGIGIGKPGSDYTLPAANRPRPFNPRAYMSNSTNSANSNRYQVNPAATRSGNRVYNNSNTRTNSSAGFQNGNRNNSGGGFNTGSNSNNNGGSYSPVRNETPTRSYNPGSSGSGSSGNRSGGGGGVITRPSRN